MATGAARAAGPTQAELNSADNDGANWLYVDHDYHGQRRVAVISVASLQSGGDDAEKSGAGGGTDSDSLNRTGPTRAMPTRMHVGNLERRN
jgi:hypothetical protein